MREDAGENRREGKTEKRTGGGKVKVDNNRMRFVVG